jgi:diadenosine tetraphosphate (Ap4A) HIT family hydrolase
MTSCILCDAVKNALSIKSSVDNTILYETNHFILIPALGPLIQGHVMIVGKEHHINLTSMGENKINEFISITRYLANLEDNLLFSEHGSFDTQQSGGACIEHVHVHVFPGLGQLVDLLDKLLPLKFTSNSSPNLDFLNKVDYPYILNFNDSGQTRMYEAYNSHSQMIRKAICNIQKRSDWNWRNDDKMDDIINTIDRWKKLIRKKSD